MRLIAALAALPALALAQTVDITVTKAVACTRKTQSGDTVSMQYTGTLTDGTQFDSNVGSGRPFEFTLGADQVIAGWDQGLLGMCIGEARRLTIPPTLAYGSQRVGPIPAGSTLVFETELLGIKGVDAEPVVPVLSSVSSVPTPTPAHLDEAPQTNASDVPAAPDALDEPVPTPPPSSSQSAAFAVPTAAPSSIAATGKHPLDGEDGTGECNLLGDFALLVQGALGLLAVSSLAVKRLREHPRRPMKIWFFDVSKQVFGSVLLHLANILMSMLSSGQFDLAAQTQSAGAAAVAAEKGSEPNPCSFYLLNLAIDTTIGIPILVLLLKILHRAFLLTPLASPPESIRSGNYGHPPRATWWLKQSIIYFLGLMGMKLCVLALFALLPWIAWVGDWALRWTEGNTALQIAFVMFVFPLVMNALQYWIVDGFIKDPAGQESGYQGLGDDEDEGEGGEDEWLERQRGSAGDHDAAEQVRRGKEPHLAVSPRAQYDPAVDGESSRDLSKTRVD
ncbi:uncharacterized protein M421DRAFT_58377 [Didymella exigua CBS 183.55]|uniref:peptidylprolyl isomerase n=1 Tax=Didymella exigua CBS 183.55 TaxID=1150837 RepID=A0A6A5RPG4_9PLEO|nr:uncharacterized protein M421DRAFT_58377 [Didymella exigua CBS 183.55]KAF1930311.1 hypothetical protein M421DRAFT_58377 [Didymella exigua CBS 183.55]